MRIYLNDLSIGGQYASPAAFRLDIAKVLRTRSRSQVVRDGLRCVRNTADLRATPTHSFRQAVMATEDRDYIRGVLGWLGKSGPFVEDDRIAHPDDLFHFGVHDVTDRGLGEAARRRLNLEDAIAFGLTGSPNGCDVDVLDVLHGLVEDPFGTVSVPNVLGPDALDALDREPEAPPRSWHDMLTHARRVFPALVLGEGIDAVLRPHPFDVYVCERVLVLMRVLQEYIDSRAQDGTHTIRTNELVATHFSGEKAWFTDESETNKQGFRQAMTFPDPLAGGNRIFCPFHGKVKSKQYRVHFAWPIAARETRVKIVYIGPKITR